MEAAEAAGGCAFDWDEYFSRSGCLPAEETAFAHVTALQRRLSETILPAGSLVGFPAGRARVLSVCGCKVLLKPGAAPSEPLWVDLSQLVAVDADADVVAPSAEETDRDTATASGDASDGVAVDERRESDTAAVRPSAADVQLARLRPTDRIAVGQYAEVHETVDPRIVWIARVQHNCAGRLQLTRIDDHMPANIHLLDYRLRPVGWGEAHNSLYAHDDALLPEHLREARQNPIPHDLFQLPAKRLVQKHQFEVGMKLEALDPVSRSHILPATVIDLRGEFYFEIEVEMAVVRRVREAPADNAAAKDTYEVSKSECIVCHRGSADIFPMYWSYRNGLRVSPPTGYPESEFSWQQYCAYTATVRNGATDEHFDFVRDFCRPCAVEPSCLRVVDDTEPTSLCAATVTRAVKHLVWLHLDHLPLASPNIIVDARSHQLYPCGFAQSHGLRLAPPADFDGDRISEPALPDFSSDIPPLFSRSDRPYMREYFMPGAATSWAPSVFINASCFCGPFLDRLKLTRTQRQVASGPIKLVLQCLLNELLSCAYRPKDVLELLQPNSTRLGGGRVTLVVKCRLKARRFRGPVEVPTDPSQFGHWARSFLARLDACPFLFSTVGVSDAASCPAKCHEQLAPLSFLAPLRHSNTSSARRVRTGAPRLTMPRRPRRPSMLDGALSGASPSVRNGVSATVRRAPRPPADRGVEGRRPVTRGVKLPRFGVVGSPLGVPARARDRLSHRSATNMAAARLVKRTTGNKLVVATEASSLCRGAISSASDGVTRRRLSAFFGRSPLPQENELPTHPPLLEASQNLPAVFDPFLTRYPIPDVDSNPNEWSVLELMGWLKGTDAEDVCDKLADEQVDGQAFMLLSLRDCMQYLELKLGPALKLAGMVRELKLVFLSRYAPHLPWSPPPSL